MVERSFLVFPLAFALFSQLFKIFIKDVKSSNGTFINGDRLSPEGLESDPYELKSDDIVVSS
jgi:pSer/pThr/pTyr-binding forkhead associated (FHA) protein